MKLTIPDMLNMLEMNGGAKMAVVVTETKPKMLVKSNIDGRPNPYEGGVTRIAVRSIALGVNYEAAVNRQRVAEGNLDYFDAEALWKGAGGKHGRYTVVHKPTGKIYFTYRPSQAWPEGMPQVLEDEWRYKGRFIAKPVEFLPKPSKAKKQDVDIDVPWRTLDLSHLVEIRYGGVYEIDHSVPAFVHAI